jgi:hypothetical protein
MIQALRGLLITTLASITIVGASNALGFGIFNSQTLLGTISLALGYSALAWIIYCAVGFCLTHTVLKGIKNPGALMMMSLALVGYTGALCLLTWMLPGLVAATLLTAAKFALHTTIVFLAIWVVGQALGILPKVKTFLPERP